MSSKISAFWQKCHVKFLHFVQFSYIYFPVKMSPPPLTELLRLYFCCSIIISSTYIFYVLHVNIADSGVTSKLEVFTPQRTVTTTPTSHNTHLDSLQVGDHGMYTSYAILHISSPDDYLALSTFFCRCGLFLPLDAEFYALSPRSFSRTAGAFYLQKNASFILLYLPKLHFQRTAWLLFCSNSNGRWVGAEYLQYN